MSEVKRFRVRNRLRAAMFDGGGKRVSEALAAAETALCGLAAVCEASIREKLAKIDRLYGPSAIGRDREKPRALYDLVLQIIDGSVCDTRSGFPEACSSLCDLLDLCADTGAWDWPAVDVHVAALNCLHTDKTMTNADRLRIVSGLVRLREHREHPQA